MLQFVFEQEINVIKSLIILRGMSQRCVSFAFCLFESFLQFNFFKINYFEVVTIYIIDNVAKKICFQCLKKKELFRNCVVMQCEHDIDFLKGKCANCVIEGYKCFFVEFVEFVEFVQLIELAQFV